MSTPTLNLDSKYINLLGARVCIGKNFSGADTYFFGFTLNKLARVFKDFREELNADKSKNINRSEVENILSDKSSDFYGEGASTLQSWFREDHLLDVREATSRKLCGDLAKHEYINSNKRKRQLSEHDGDWDLSRKYDIRPFNKAHNTPIRRKHINIYVNGGFHAGTPIELITQYCTTIWALVDYIEKTGVSVNLFMQYGSLRAYPQSNIKHTLITVKIKDSSEFISKQLTSSVFSGEFFRRYVFALKIAFGDIVQAPVCSFLGSADGFKELHQAEFTHKDGNLYIGGKLLSLDPSAAIKKITLELFK